MMHFAYIASLCVALFGMGMIDRKYRLAFFANWRRTSVVLAVAVCVFVLWDLGGIGLGIFSKGDSSFSLEFELLPELPIEELFFLLLLNYLSLLGYLYVTRMRK